MSYMLGPSNLRRCEKCGRDYNATRLNSCPKCRSIELSNESKVLERQVNSESSLEDIEKIMVENQERQIAATNRTTHAVRAFVLFLFYQLSSITTAAILYFLAVWVGNQNDECEPILRQYGACDPQPFLLLLALIVWVSGVVYSSKVGWEEIKKSDI